MSFRELEQPPPLWLSRFVRDELHELLFQDRETALAALARWSANLDEQARSKMEWEARRDAFLLQPITSPEDPRGGNNPPGEGWGWNQGPVCVDERGLIQVAGWTPPELSAPNQPRVDEILLPPRLNRDWSPDECWACLLAVHDWTWDTRLVRVDSIPFALLRNQVSTLAESNLLDLRRMIQTVQHSSTPADLPLPTSPPSDAPDHRVADVSTMPVDVVPWPEFMSAADLAARLGRPPDSTRKMLERWADDHPNCFIENDSPRRGEAKILYRVGDVRHLFN